MSVCVCVCVLDLLRCFLTEREQMKDELRSLKEKVQVSQIYYFILHLSHHLSLSYFYVFPVQRTLTPYTLKPLRIGLNLITNVAGERIKLESLNVL